MWEKMIFNLDLLNRDLNNWKIVIAWRILLFGDIYTKIEEGALDCQTLNKCHRNADIH